MEAFDWNLFKNRNFRIAVHCKTEEEAKDFCRQMHEHNLKWFGGSSYLKYTNWCDYKEDTCYGNTGGYCNYDYYKKNRYVILNWCDYIDSDHVESVEEFIMRTGRKVEYI